MDLTPTLSALVHGDPGVGKSWFAGSGPTPRVIFDAEGRAKYVPGRKVIWDPRKYAPPVNDGTWDTAVVPVHDPEVVALGHQWLRSGQHPFVSADIDSLMMTQKRAMDRIAGANSMTTQDWGTLLRQMENMVRTFHDLTLVPETGIKVVAFTVGEGDTAEGAKLGPLLQGQLRRTVAYFVDVVGWMYAEAAADGVSTTRKILVHPRPGVVAKDNTGLLPGPVIELGDMRQGAQPLTELYNYMLQASAAGVQPAVAAAPDPAAVPVQLAPQEVNQ